MLKGLKFECLFNSSNGFRNDFASAAKTSEPVSCIAIVSFYPVSTCFPDYKALYWDQSRVG